MRASVAAAVLSVFFVAQPRVQSLPPEFDRQLQQQADTDKTRAASEGFMLGGHTFDRRVDPTTLQR